MRDTILRDLTNVFTYLNQHAAAKPAFASPQPGRLAHPNALEYTLASEAEPVRASTATHSDEDDDCEGTARRARSLF